MSGFAYQLDCSILEGIEYDETVFQFRFQSALGEIRHALACIPSRLASSRIGLNNWCGFLSSIGPGSFHEYPPKTNASEITGKGQRQTLVAGQYKVIATGCPSCLLLKERGRGDMPGVVRGSSNSLKVKTVRMSKISFLKGSVSKPVKVILRSFHNQDAPSLESDAASALAQAGFAVKRQVKVPNRGDGRSGKIDLVATKDREVLAIELDCKTPRFKSIFKVTHYPNATASIVVCRGKRP